MILMMVRFILSIILTPFNVSSEDTVITLADWYESFLPSLNVALILNLKRYHFVSPQAPPIGTIAVANSTLINGLGRFAGGPSSPLAVVSVIPKKRYRFRLISVSCDPNFIFSIDGHNLVSCLN